MYFNLPPGDSAKLFVSVNSWDISSPDTFRWYRNDTLLYGNKDYYKATIPGDYSVICGYRNSFQKTDTLSVKLGEGKIISHMPFNNNTMDIINQIEGLPFGCKLTADRFGKENMAYEFNGESDFIRVPDADVFSFNLDHRFSISVWVYVQDTTRKIAILSKRGINGPFEYSLDNYFSNSFFNFDNWIGSGNGPVYGTDPLKAVAPIDVGEWMHLVYISDGDTLKVYKNGVRMSGVDVRPYNRYFTNTTADLSIGVGGGWGKSYYFKGKIDDIRFYNYPLRQWEIEQVYNEPTGMDEVEKDHNVGVYPNPVSDEIFFVRADKIRLFTVTGALVKERENVESMMVSELPSGIYFLEINRQGKIFFKKIVKN